MSYTFAEVSAAGVRRDLEKLASGLGVDGRINFCDGISLDQIPKVIANADIGVVPITDTFCYEAYSTKIVEFMSQGIPVVASRTAMGNCHFSDDTVCFFNSGDDRAMAEVLLRLIDDPQLRERLSINGLDYAARNNWNSKKAEYLSLVDSLCAERLRFADSEESGPEVPLEPFGSRRRE